MIKPDNFSSLPSESKGRSVTAHYQRLVADIGGTNVRFAVTCAPDEGDPARLEETRSFARADVDNIEAAINRYMADIGLRTCPPELVLAVAGPIEDGTVRLTNGTWAFSEHSLRTRYNIHHVRLINDFEGQALALPHLARCDLCPIGQSALWAPEPKGARLALGPGTGFGVGVLWRQGGQDIAAASEAGHVGFAPQSEEEAKIQRFLATRYPRVTNERVLCGPGLLDLYAYWCMQANEQPKAQTPEAVTALAAEGVSGAAQAALDSFFAVLGAVAGDMALAFNAVGGVYLAGGLLPQIADKLKESRFRARFDAKWPYQERLARIPTYLILHKEAALLGCAALRLEG